MNPELDEAGWSAYDQKTCNVGHLKRSDLEVQPTFAQSWPLFHAFLSSLEGSSVIIAHNGLRFDCRVLLSELRRTNLLDSHSIPSNIKFMDSYMAFLDIEKGYHEEVGAIMSNINWKIS